MISQVMLLVGGTGSGKTTLLNAIVNYCYDVTFDDNFRFQVITAEEEMAQSGNTKMTSSMTRTVTAYTFYDTILPYRYRHKSGFSNDAAMVFR